MSTFTVWRVPAQPRNEAMTDLRRQIALICDYQPPVLSDAISIRDDDLCPRLLSEVFKSIGIEKSLMLLKDLKLGVFDNAKKANDFAISEASRREADVILL